MRIVLDFETDNAAFTDPRADEDDHVAHHEACDKEAALVTEFAARKIRAGLRSGPLLDSNGNTVGTFTVEGG